MLTTVPGSQAPSALLTFRLTALLAFYLDTVKGFVPEGASLCVAIGDCRALAQRTLFDVLKTKGCARLTASLTRVRLDSPQSGRLRFKWFNIEPRDSPNEPHASPPGGFPSACNRAFLSNPLLTLSQVHTRTVRGGPKGHSALSLLGAPGGDDGSELTCEQRRRAARTGQGEAHATPAGGGEGPQPAGGVRYAAQRADRAAAEPRCVHAAGGGGGGQTSGTRGGRRGGSAGRHVQKERGRSKGG